MLKNQFDFMLSRSVTEAIYLLQNLIEKNRSKERDIHMVFIDLEKPYNRFLRKILGKALEKEKKNVHIT